MAATILTDDRLDAPRDAGAPTGRPPAGIEPIPRSGGRAVRCRHCGQPIESDSAPVISSHRWSRGWVSYLRCRCGGVGIAVLEQATAA